MKKIEVVAAIIQREGAYFATQRGYGEFEGMWEFPGGKIEQGESAADALKRELFEELSLEFSNSQFFSRVDFNYPEKNVSLMFYEVHGLITPVVANEGQDWCWVAPLDLPQYAFPEANISIVEALVSQALRINR